MAQPRPFGINDRQHPRTKVSGEGIIVFDEGRFAIQCTVIDLSESGAQVRLPLGIAVPEHFHLVTSIPRLAYECVMAWRKPLVCGVRFAAQHRLDTPPAGQENFAQTWRDLKSRCA